MTKEERKEYYKKWYQANKTKKLEHKKQWYEANKEKILENQAEYYKKHKVEKAELNKKYHKEHREEILEHHKQYDNTPMGRAHYLRKNHIQNDRKYGRIGDELPINYITTKWIVENIFTKPCAHCGISGWEVIGCNRLDNALPHTKNNVEPCCFICNCRQPR